MSLKARLDRLTRELAFGERFDGTTVEDLARYGFFSAEPDENAPNGVWRAATYIGIQNIWDHLHNPAKAQETREKFGIADDETDSQIKARLISMGAEEGLNKREIRDLERDLTWVKREFE